MSQIVEVFTYFQTNFAIKTESPFKVLKILVCPGRQVMAEDPLAEIDTDKGLQDILAPADGIVKEIFLNADPVIEYFYGTAFCTIETA